MMQQCESSEHKATLASEKEETLAQIKLARERASARKEALTSNEQCFSQQAEPTTEGFEQLPVRTNIKTRAPHSMVEPEPDFSEETDELPSVLYTLKVNSVTNMVVNQMFPDPADNLTRGPIIWSDFLTAMTELGFGTQVYGGSALKFRGQIMLPKSTETQDRSIVVHRPRPGNELTPVEIRIFGKRCTKRFGWQRVHFKAN